MQKKHMQQIVCEDANCVANAKIKCSYSVLPMKENNPIEIDLSNISFSV